MRHRQAALGHHFDQIPQTELEPKIPAHAQDDDFAVEVATFEQLRHHLQLAHRRPQPAQHANVADRPPPFAPEPRKVGCLPFHIDIAKRRVARLDSIWR